MICELIYQRPDVQVVESLDAFFRSLVPRTRPSAELDWRAEKLKELVDADPTRVCHSLEDVCKELGFPMSNRQARRLFKGSTGMSIKKYARTRRLFCAAEQLKTSNTPVKAIATDAGYQNPRDFARRFKQLFHLSPVEFRTVWRLKHIVA